MAAGDITTNLRTYLLTISAITDQVSTRIFPEVLPQNATLPAVVYRYVSATPLAHLTSAAKVVTSRIQIDCYATTTLAASVAAEAIRKNLQHYSGAAGDDNIDVALEESRRSNYEPPQDATDLGLFVDSRDYLIIHNEPAVST